MKKTTNKNLTAEQEELILGFKKVEQNIRDFFGMKIKNEFLKNLRNSTKEEIKKIIKDFEKKEKK